MPSGAVLAFTDVQRAGLAPSLRPGRRAKNLWALAAAVEPLEEGRADLAAAFYRGQFTLAGQGIDCPPDGIFDAALSKWQRRDLFGFGWLIHLESSGRELYRTFARGLVDNWLARSIGHRPEAAARRAISLVRHAPFLLQGASETFADAFFAYLDRELCRLARDRTIDAALALATAALGLRQTEARETAALNQLEAALEAVVLPDGGTRSRDPSEIATLLLDLLPLRAAAERRRIALPAGLDAAIERLLPMLRFFRHGDGGLAAFQGAAEPMTGDIRRILDRDTSLGLPLAHAPQAGFARLQQRNALVIADVGQGGAHHGALAFEFSDGVQRLVVNCGAPRPEAEGWQSAARARAAHSTYDGIGTGAVSAELIAMPEGMCLRAASAAGHDRTLFLAASGADLRGEDRVSAGGCCLRFHLHPAVKATLAADGATVLLQLHDRSAWTFSARGGAIVLEDSIYLFGETRPRRTRQIVVAGAPLINWAFKRIQKPLKDKSAPDAQLLLDWS